MDDQSELQDDDVSTIANDGPTSNIRSSRTAFGPLFFPSQMVTITVMGGHEFHLHKDVLTKDSAYFERALNGPFSEGQTQSIDLDDIESPDFGRYVSVLYPTTLVGNMSLYDIWNLDDSVNVFSWSNLLRLWQLADRFLNYRIREIAEIALEDRFKKFTVNRWLRTFKDSTWSEIKMSVSGLNSSFRLCKDEGLPFRYLVIKSFSNCPPQVFAECVGELDDDFKSEVMKMFALRHANPELTAKRKQRDESQEAKERAKKQKQ